MVATQSTRIEDLKSRWQKLDSDAKEIVVADNFIRPFLEVLGFDQYSEIYPQFPTGRNNAMVDFAARKNTQNDQFITTKKAPHLILEVKGRNVNISEGKAPYRDLVNQLKRYLLDPNCKTVKWGIISNGDHIQLFRKHEKVIYPASPCIKITQDNLEGIITLFKQRISRLIPALTVAIYNNKGGVGKTTTTVNLAGTLTRLGKKVLVIDFDFQQRDLTTSLGLSCNQETLFEVLKEPRNSIQKTIVKFSQIFQTKTGEQKSLSFDVIPASDNKNSISESEIELRKYCNLRTLSKVLEPLRFQYHYILIDTPPNKNFFSESGIYAANVVLIPAKHNNLFSLKNAAVAITQFIPEIQQQKKQGNPIALPIFFNGETMTEAQKKQANEAINLLIKNTKNQNKFDLEPYFYPHSKNSKITAICNHAIIAKAPFVNKPAVYIHKTIFESYSAFAREYFLQ
ncbi:MAG TPA: chromosome partitioning protein [Cyanothece sp. UBA12306]|nr:chromosome partitioning protein [Cyanothece sp. UBA12306]